LYYPQTSPYQLVPDDCNLFEQMLILSGLFLIIMPYCASFIMKYTIELTVKIGCLISMIIFLFPPLFFMGIVSPISIEIMTSYNKSAGKSAGYLYAISTFSGILMTFFAGFYLIPEFGLKYSAIIFGLIQIFSPVVILFERKKNMSIFFILILFRNYFHSQPIHLEKLYLN